MKKLSKYSTWSKEELIKRIEALEKRKKYGLVWDEERTKEKFEDDSEGKLPVLKEIKSKEIKTDPDKPTHILIEGDNYHALSVLNYTHEKSIDMIYFDPPYNTGNKDFKYNDAYVDKEDSYRHSKWLSFINKRLVIARQLLKPHGLIFTSIDDNEVAQLKLLYDEIFGESNFVALLPTIMNLKGNQDQFGFAGTHEYTLVYCRDKNEAKINEFLLDDEETDEWLIDEYGYYNKGANLKSTGVNAPRDKRPNLFFPIFYNKNRNDLYVTDNDKPKEKKDLIALPVTDGKEMSWRWSKTKIKNEKHNIIISLNNDNTFTLYKKQRPSLGDLPSKKPKSIFYKPEYSSGNGTALIKKIFGEKVFNNPKPLELIKDILKISTNKKSKVLDFTAGSGTTAQALLELNEEDNGYRQFILCTNNENNICSDVCYPRIAKNIKGFKSYDEESIEGLGGNLKYFKTSFVPSEPTDKNKELLTKEAVEMLCLRENTFDKVSENDKYKIFRNNEKYTGIIFDQLAITKFKKESSKYDKPINVYVFSLGDDDFSADFGDMKQKIKVCSIPEAILRIYRRIFK